MRFVALDALRGICALWVVIFHIEIIGGIRSWIFHGSKIVEHGFIFVDFFFVLSGFVLTHTYFARLRGYSDVCVFLLRRLGRVYPLHLLLLALFIAFEFAKLYAISSGLAGKYPPFTAATSPFAIVTNLFLAQSLGLHSSATWNLPAWSISAEFYVYVIFAFCAWLVRDDKAKFIFAAAFLAFFGAAVVFAYSPYYIDTIYDYAIFRCLYGFFVGALSYAVAERLRKRLEGPGWLFLSLELAATIACIVFVHSTGTTPLSLAAPLVFAVAVIVFSFEKGWISSRLLQTRPFRYFGEISYAIYISHALALVAAARLFNVLRQKTGYIETFRYAPDEYRGLELELMAPADPILAGLAIVGLLLLVILFSAALNRWIETPCRDYFNALAKDWRGRRDRSESRGEREARPRAGYSTAPAASRSAR